MRKRRNTFLRNMLKIIFITGFILVCLYYNPHKEYKLAPNIKENSIEQRMI